MTAVCHVQAAQASASPPVFPALFTFPVSRVRPLFTPSECLCRCRGMAALFLPAAETPVPPKVLHLTARLTSSYLNTEQCPIHLKNNKLKTIRGRKYEE